jgi:hypothetical protein
VIKALCCRGVVSACETDDARLEARVRKKVRADLAQARVWDPRFALLSSTLADRKLCEYTRVLQLSTLEQRVYASTEATPDAPKPVGPWKKFLAWLAVAGLTLYPMCVPMLHFRRRLPAALHPQSPARRRYHRFLPASF